MWYDPHLYNEFRTFVTREQCDVDALPSHRGEGGGSELGFSGGNSLKSKTNNDKRMMYVYSSPHDHFSHLPFSPSRNSKTFRRLNMMPRWRRHSSLPLLCSWVKITVWDRVRVRVMVRVRVKTVIKEGVMMLMH